MRRILAFWFFLPVFIAAQGCAHNQNLELQDRALIADQVAKYAQLWDRKDAKNFSLLFTEDATIEWHIASADSQPPSVTGRDKILQYSFKAHQERIGDRQSRHHFSGLVFEEISTTHAVTEHVFMVTHVAPGETPILKGSGTYKIEWKKTDQGWLISHRKLYVDR